MVATAVREFSFSDLDRALKEEILDYIDYSYRFRQQAEQTVDDIVSSMFAEVNEKIREFYESLPNIVLDVRTEDIVREYQNSFME